MSVRWSLVGASVLTAGWLGVGQGIAEELAPEQARAFVVGKLFAYTCFEGTSGMGRIYSDGSVVGTIKIHGQGQTRFAALPAGTIRIDSQSMCAHLAGMPFTPCFRVEKIDYRSFRGSLSGLGFAYCDFRHQGAQQMLMARAVARPRSVHTTGSTRSADASHTEVSTRVQTPAVESSRLGPVRSVEPATTESAPELRRSTE